MGIIYAEIELINSFDMLAHKKGILPDNQIKKMKVKALVDTGAYMLSINEEL
jgi:hypothetical protein